LDCASSHDRPKRFTSFLTPSYHILLRQKGWQEEERSEGKVHNSTRGIGEYYRESFEIPMKVTHNFKKFSEFTYAECVVISINLSNIIYF